MTRTGIFRLTMASIFLALALGLFSLEVVQARRYRDLSDKNCIRLLPQPGARGKILDREANVIVDNKLSYDVLISPQDSEGLDRTLSRLSGVLGIGSEDLRSAFRKGYVSVSLPITIARNIESKKAIALEELKLDLPGVIIQPNPVRNYPHGRLGCHVLGYVSEIDRWRLTKLVDYGYKTKDIVGFGGVEEKYDYYLRQEEGGLSVQVDHRGRFVRTLGFRPPINGKDIQLTLDLRVQKIAEEALEERKGCVVIMQPYTGEIIAMASAPNFNPGLFGRNPKSDSYLSSLFSDRNAPFLNRAISGVYPPGSVFKIIVATAALETKRINSDTAFLCQGKVYVGKQEFACWDTHGRQNLIAAITHSCNVFFYRTGLVLGAQAIHDYALKFGFSKATNLDLPYESSGFIPSPLWRKINRFKNWFEGDTANLSIGQGEVLITPLQMARAMAVFANGGYLVTPYIVKDVSGQDISRYQRKVSRLGLKEGTVSQVRRGLRGVVSDETGTARVLSDLTVSVAGKTGTAQAPPGQPHAWFAGFFPFEEPKFVICVFLERGGPGYLSALLTRRIIEAMLNQGLI